MTTRSRLMTWGGAAVLALVAGVATAQPIDKRTTMTFSGPVAVPGVTLPAGSYIFHFTDVNNRGVMQVLSGDNRVAYAQFQTIEAWRNKVTYDPEVRFLETAADMPHAIRTFWYPGDSIGFDFLYPGDQKNLLAKGLGTAAPVLAEVPAAPAVVAPIEEAEAPYVAPEPVLEEPAPVEVAEAAPAPAPEVAPAELPKTDSPTATMLLVGFGALLVGVFVHTMRTTLA